MKKSNYELSPSPRELFETVNCSQAIAIALAAGVALGFSALVFASSDLPEEAIGYDDSSYSLSQYETINLENGNLTFRVPLYTLRTDGGLTYDLVYCVTQMRHYPGPFGRA